MTAATEPATVAEARQPSTRPTRREWTEAARDLLVAVAGAVFVLVALDQGLVLLAQVAIEMGWGR